MSETLLRLPEVIKKTGLSRSTIYNKIKDDPLFPKQIKLSERCVGFLESELDAWITSRVSESRSASQQEANHA